MHRGMSNFENKTFFAPKSHLRFRPAAWRSWWVYDTMWELETTELHVLRARPTLSEPRFLKYVCLTKQFLDEGVARFQGVAGLQRVPAEFIEDFQVTDAEIGQQTRIADFLDDQVARVDQVVAMRRHQLVLNSRRHRAALANAAMVLGADDPRTQWMKSKSAWRLLPLKAVAKNLDSRRVPLSSEQRSFRRGDYRYFGASAVVDMIDDFIF